jgi:hypothetical protein
MSRTFKNPLSGLPGPSRLRRVLGLLEVFITTGKVHIAKERLDAVKTWLQHYRWEFEHAHGKAASKASLEIDAELRLVRDNISTVPAELEAAFVELTSAAIGVRPAMVRKMMAEQGESRTAQDVVLVPGDNDADTGESA